MSRAIASISLGLLLLSNAAAADESRIFVRGERILLGEVAPDVDERWATVDLGPAPPPGRSRYLSREEMSARLQALGIAASRLSLPEGVRVESEARSFSPSELAELVRPVIVAALPAGVTLRELEVHGDMVLSPSVSTGEVRLPRFALREGSQRQTATVELRWGREVQLRLPVQVVVEVSSQLTDTVVPRGSSLTLVVRRGPVEISALAETLGESRVGQIVSVRIGVTKKVVSARLMSNQRAELSIE